MPREETAGGADGLDHSSLTAEIDSFSAIVSGLAATGTLSTGGDGALSTDLTITLNTGLNVIDIDTGDNGGSIDISNAQGCVQLVADIVDMDNIRFTRSSFGVIPAPSGVALFGLGALTAARRRRG